MKKFLSLGLVISMLFAGTAYADILPEGQKYVPVCAYFDNTASVLDTMAIYGYETAPDGTKVDLSSFIANECFTLSYKFNTYGVYGLTAEHAATINADTYEPNADTQAYPTNIDVEIGQKLILSTSNIEKYENVYHIVELDTEGGHLIIEPVATKIYTTGVTEPETLTGVITSIVETPTLYEDAFSDVDSNNTYYTSVKYLKDEGIIGGYPDGSYKPDNTINRAEFTKIVIGSTATQEALDNCMYNYTVESDYHVNVFTDVVFMMVGGNEPEWYFNYVCVAKHTGVVSGYPDGSFQPANKIKFVEAAKIVTEAMGYQMMTDTDPWYMGYVKELANRKAIPTSITSFGQEITRGEMAEIMYRLKANITNLESKTYEELI